MIISSQTTPNSTSTKDSAIPKPTKTLKPKEIEVKPVTVFDTKEDVQQLRPVDLKNYIGQKKLKKQLNLILESSKLRGVLPEHILFYGQPGLGKTTMAGLISQELQANFKVIAAPSLQKVGDLVSILLNLEEKTVLFIDEIHRLKAPLEESLYTAMEDGKIDLVMGKGTGSQVARLDLPNFMLIGATTQLGKISKPLKDRFPTVFQLESYLEEEILKLLNRNSKILGLKLDEEAKLYVCKRCRGVPRVANNILKRLLDYQIVHKLDMISERDCIEFLNELGVFENGLTKSDLVYLQALKNGTVGLKTLAAVLMEEIETVELVIEPYLIHLGMVDKSTGGRLLTQSGRVFLNKMTGKGTRELW